MPSTTVNCRSTVRTTAGALNSVTPPGLSKAGKLQNRSENCSAKHCGGSTNPSTDESRAGSVTR
jgi:hypothetical protein